MTTLTNPLPRLSPREKKRLIIGGVGIAGLLGIGWYLAKKNGTAAPKEPVDYGIQVDQLCVNAKVTDQERLRRALEDTFDTQVDAGVTDPFVITTAFFAKIAPQCTVHPREARSPKEAAFYLTVFAAFLGELENNALITEDESRAKIFEAMAWASRAGWKPTQQIDSLL
jgi:hypothetical protein